MRYFVTAGPHAAALVSIPLAYFENVSRLNPVPTFKQTEGEAVQQGQGDRHAWQSSGSFHRDIPQSDAAQAVKELFHFRCWK